MGEKKAIGKVMLCKNRLGWVDFANKIVLTMKNNESLVYEDQPLYLIELGVSKGAIEFIRFEDK